MLTYLYLLVVNSDTELPPSVDTYIAELAIAEKDDHLLCELSSKQRCPATEVLLASCNRAAVRATWVRQPWRTREELLNVALTDKRSTVNSALAARTDIDLDIVEALLKKPSVTVQRELALNTAITSSCRGQAVAKCATAAGMNDLLVSNLWKLFNCDQDFLEQFSLHCNPYNALAVMDIGFTVPSEAAKRYLDDFVFPYVASDHQATRTYVLSLIERLISQRNVEFDRLASAAAHFLSNQGRKSERTTAQTRRDVTSVVDLAGFHNTELMTPPLKRTRDACMLTYNEVVSMTNPREVFTLVTGPSCVIEIFTAVGDNPYLDQDCIEALRRYVVSETSSFGKSGFRAHHLKALYRTLTIRSLNSQRNTVHATDVANSDGQLATGSIGAADYARPAPYGTDDLLNDFRLMPVSDGIDLLVSLAEHFPDLVRSCLIPILSHVEHFYSKQRVLAHPKLIPLILDCFEELPFGRILVLAPALAPLLFEQLLSVLGEDRTAWETFHVLARDAQKVSQSLARTAVALT